MTAILKQLSKIFELLMVILVCQIWKQNKKYNWHFFKNHLIIISWLGDGQKMCNFKLHNAHKTEQTDFLRSAISNFSDNKFLGCWINTSYKRQEAKKHEKILSLTLWNFFRFLFFVIGKFQKKGVFLLWTLVGWHLDCVVRAWVTF